MRGEIRCAELLGPPAGEALTLIASGEERQPFGISDADVAEPLRGQGQRLVPLDFLEVAGATFTICTM